MEFTRRTAMRSVGVAGGVAAFGGTAGALSGCTEESSGGGSTEKPTDASVATSDVPVGSGTVVSESYVVTQPTKGEFHAFSSVCTHQGCQVRDISAKTITCPCHGSQFSATTGEVVNGPATDPLPEYTVAEDGETLTLSAG